MSQSEKEAFDESDLIEEFDLKKTPSNKHTAQSSRQPFMSHTPHLYPILRSSSEATEHMKNSPSATAGPLVQEHLSSKTIYPSLVMKDPRTSEEYSEAVFSPSEQRSPPSSASEQTEPTCPLSARSARTEQEEPMPLLSSSELSRRQDLIKEELHEYETRMDYFAKALAGETRHQQEEKLKREKEREKREEKRRETMEKRIQQQLERALEREERQLHHLLQLQQSQEQEQQSASSSSF
jgi:hypothetical protein